MNNQREKLLNKGFSKLENFPQVAGGFRVATILIDCSLWAAIAESISWKFPKTYDAVALGFYAPRPGRTPLEHRNTDPLPRLEVSFDDAQ